MTETPGPQQKARAKARELYADLYAKLPDAQAYRSEDASFQILYLIEAALATVEQETREECAQMAEALATEVTKRAMPKPADVQANCAIAIQTCKEIAAALRSHGGETQ